MPKVNHSRASLQRGSVEFHPGLLFCWKWGWWGFLGQSFKSRFPLIWLLHPQSNRDFTSFTHFIFKSQVNFLKLPTLILFPVRFVVIDFGDTIPSTAPVLRARLDHKERTSSEAHSSVSSQINSPGSYSLCTKRKKTKWNRQGLHGFICPIRNTFRFQNVSQLLNTPLTTGAHSKALTWSVAGQKGG